MRKLLLIKYTCLSLVSLISLSCNSENSKAKIKGNLTNSKGQMLYLEELTPTKIDVLDSCKVDEKGFFAFTHEIKSTAFYRVRESQNNFFNMILSPEEKVDITGDATNLAFTYTVTGSEESSRLKDLNVFLTKLYQLSDSLNREIQGHQMKQDVENYMKALTIAQELGNKQSVYINDFVTKKPGSLSSLAAVTKLDPEQDYAMYKKVAEGLKATMPTSAYYTQFSEQVAELGKLSIGALAPDITLSDPDGKVKSLSSLRGNVVLIDFWASWCKPCRAENPNVVKLYNKYHSKGFDVLGVSLDKSKESWIQAIKQDGLTWNHISDLGYWNSSVVALYGIKGIPQTYLLDKEGIIIGKNLRGADLENKLATLFQ